MELGDGEKDRMSVERNSKGHTVKATVVFDGSTDRPDSFEKMKARLQTYYGYLDITYPREGNARI